MEKSSKICSENQQNINNNGARQVESSKCIFYVISKQNVTKLINLKNLETFLSLREKEKNLDKKLYGESIYCNFLYVKEIPKQEKNEKGIKSQYFLIFYTFS